MEMSLGGLAFAGFIAAQFVAVVAMHRDKLLEDGQLSRDAKNASSKLAAPERMGKNQKPDPAILIVQEPSFLRCHLGHEYTTS